MSKQMIVARIYVGESDSGPRGNLMEHIMEVLRDQHRVHGVTVFRGIAGFGSSGVVHSADLLRLNPNLPLVIEFFDEPEVIEAAVETLNDLIPAGQMISWPVTCNLD
ncbi:MAG: DUF190 domain-containing protein [Gammaproteobacteria bacterium]|nr:DUF190 domain-containing protein [Gammaproteobacteria bacterium]